MSVGERLERAIRGRRRRTRELARRERRQRRALEWRRRRTGELLRRYRRTGSRADLERYRRSRALAARSRGLTARLRRMVRASRRKLASWRARASDRLWGGSRALTNEVIRIVGARAPVTSRKRTATFGNPGSDHHVSQTAADAVDFGIADAHWLKNEISRKLGGPPVLADYDSFRVRRNGRSYRVQAIAGDHGLGPHLHVGVRRA